MAWLAQSIGLGGQTGTSGGPSSPGAGVFAGPPSPGGGSPSLPSGISPKVAQQAAYFTSQGVPPDQAYLMATMMGQQPSPWASVAAGAGGAANEVLAAELRPELGEAVRPTQIQVQGNGPLPIAAAPSPMPATTTDSMIAALL